MSHGAAAGGEGEEEGGEEAEEEEEDEEEESAPPEFDARCQATPLELVRVRAWKCFRCGWLCLFVCARARSCVYVGTDSRRREPRTGREVCRGVQTEIRGGDFGWAG